MTKKFIFLLFFTFIGAACGSDGPEMGDYSVVDTFKKFQYGECAHGNSDGLASTDNENWEGIVLGRGLCLAATGSGKTEIIAQMIPGNCYEVFIDGRRSIDSVIRVEPSNRCSVANASYEAPNDNTAPIAGYTVMEDGEIEDYPTPPTPTNSLGQLIDEGEVETQVSPNTNGNGTTPAPVLTD